MYMYQNSVSHVSSQYISYSTQKSFLVGKSS